VRALVTGSAGFLGRHFVHELEERGWHVVGLDVSLASHLDCRDFFRRDLSYWDLAIHAAAVVEGRQTIERNPMRQAVDLALDAEAFTWALRARVRRLVYLSSSAVYPVDLQGFPDPDCGPVARAGDQEALLYRLVEGDVDLDCPRLPDSLYGWTKLTGERLAALARDAGQRVTVVRPFSGYGPDQAASYPFRAFLERAKRRDDPFEVWGDGTQVRDWIHVDDVVGATLAAVTFDVDGPLNVCSGRGVSLGALAMMFAHFEGYEPAYHYDVEQPRGVSYRVGDPERMCSVYQPRFSLEEGVRRALGRWM
jgi:nucleoside-diphosphate-sugar epimerase